MKQRVLKMCTRQGQNYFTLAIKYVEMGPRKCHFPIKQFSQKQGAQGTSYHYMWITQQSNIVNAPNEPLLKSH